MRYDKNRTVKYMGDKGKLMLIITINKIWNTKIIPKEQETAIILSEH